jgi:transcriptional regulator with XRE-family HTH domain
MKERLNEILKHLKINASQFADQIGVQRASVSHVLSGRNKPGFDFIQKIIAAYPSISAEWLITGQGDIVKSKISRQDLFSEIEIEENETIEEQKRSGKPVNKNVSDSNTGQKAIRSKHIEKIIVFYSDKSFEEYFPEQL